MKRASAKSAVIERSDPSNAEVNGEASTRKSSLSACGARESATRMWRDTTSTVGYSRTPTQ
eukprot:6185502-Pleurochrysis_carterae.AAC.1